MMEDDLLEDTHGVLIDWDEKMQELENQVMKEKE